MTILKLFQKSLLAASLLIAILAVTTLAAEVPLLPTPPASSPPAAPDGYVFAPNTNGTLSLWKVAGEVTVTNTIRVHVLSGRLVDVKIMYQETLTNAPVYTGEHMLFVMGTTNTSGFYTAHLETQE